MTIEWNANDLGFKNYYNSQNIPTNTLIEVTIVNVIRREFEENGAISIKAVLQLDNGFEIVLNKTRRDVLVTAFGINPNNWIGKQITVSRGSTMYSGKPVGCVDILPTTAPLLPGGSTPASPRIEGLKPLSGAAEQLPVEKAPASNPRGARGRGSATITSGRQTAADELKVRRPDLVPDPDDPSDEIPF